MTSLGENIVSKKSAVKTYTELASAIKTTASPICQMVFSMKRWLKKRGIEVGEYLKPFLERMTRLSMMTYSEASTGGAKTDDK
ncbi:hypothetical protein TYRP_003091 [Tyrophagus putrescentiae]|nr:hypothetical protein TYRP_003091 [Tyrophagus putrescentiae]